MEKEIIFAVEESPEGGYEAKALRLARNAIKAKYPNPFYWAAFILHGEGE